MAIVKNEDDGRVHVSSPLMGESLMRQDVIDSTHIEDEIKILPDVNVVAVGGQSLIDRGKAALFPLLAEIVECRKHHKIILGVGGGARVRHTYDLCLGLGIPTGGMAMLAGGCDEQNTRMLGALLAKDKGIVLSKDHFLDLPLWLEQGMIPIMVGMPPYHYWEPCSGERRLPENNHDLGLFMVAEVLGARSMIFLKDEDGLHTADPKKEPSARLIERISAQELLSLDMPDMIIERSVVETLTCSRRVHEIHIVNGLKPHTLRQALDGEAVGTTIYCNRQES